MNVVNLVGRLGADPETRYLSSGDPVTNFRMATGSGDYTEWHRIVCFKKTAEIASEYLRKGSSVAVEGRLQTRKWQNKDGVDQYTTEVVANRVHFVGSKTDGGDGRQEPRRQAAKPSPEPGPDDFDDPIPF